MNLAFPSLSFRTSLASLTGATLAFVALTAPVKAQILYDTTSFAGSSPGSTAAAIASFDSLAASSSGYGCATVTTLDGVNNQTQFSDGSQNNLAYHQAAVFVVAPSQAGLWSFRWGGDFGKGGTLLLDGVELQSSWSDMWWNGAFVDPNQYLVGSANLMAGTHIVEIFAFEDCCDGPGNAQFLAQMSAAWQDISAANLTLVPAACGGPALLLTGAASPSPVLAGSQLTFRLFYESTGQSAAADAALSTAIPADTTFVSATGGGTFSNGAVNWTLGSLGVGVSGTATFTVQVGTPLGDGTTISDLASLTATGATTATATTNVTASNALLTLGSASAPNPVAAGAPLTITLHYANTGIGVGGMATIVDALPANTTFVSASNAGAYDASSNRVSWDLGALDMDAAGSVSYVVQIATPLANGTVLGDLATFSATNNAATVTATSSATVTSAPSLTLTNTGAPNPVPAGTQLTYTLAFANHGTDVAHRVILSDTLPANLGFISASDGGSYDSGTKAVSWSLPDLVADGSGTVTLIVLVNASATGVLSDTAKLTATNNTTPIPATAMTMVASPPRPDAGTSDAAAGGAGGTGTGGIGTGPDGSATGDASATGDGSTTATGSAGADGGSATGSGGAGGTSPDGSATGVGGAGGNTGAAGAAAGGSAGKAGAAGGSNASSGCGCAVGDSGSPTGLVGLAAMLGLMLASRRRRRR